MKAREMIKINQPQVLLKYLKTLLENGITTGVKEEEYFSFINEVATKINESDSQFMHLIDIEEESFSDIAESANKISRSCICPNTTGIKVQTVNEGKLIALPTYELKKNDNAGMIIGYYGEDRILTDIIASRIKPMELSSYDISQASKENLQIAMRVGSFYINDLINRYVYNRSEKGNWPSQCKDVDKYIFDRDIASLIDEQGTKANFQEAYSNAIKSVCEMLHTRKEDETIEFSNNPYNMLAYANYLRFVLPESLQFLKRYEYNEYQLHNDAIKLTIVRDQVYYQTSSCVSTDPYGDWSDGYKKTKGILDDAPVKIMQKRIGEII